MSSVFLKKLLKFPFVCDKLSENNRKSNEWEVKSVSPTHKKGEAVCLGKEPDNQKWEMDKLNFSLESAVQKLITMFEETGKQYSCNRTKIGKLLSIFSFAEACEGKIVFSEKIRKYSDCGTKIDELILIIPREIYFSDEKNDSGEEITDYNQDPSDIEEWRLLYDVFVRFGAYDRVSLGELITAFIQLPGIIASDDTVDLETVYSLSIKGFSDLPLDNELIDFLRKYGRK